MSYPQPEADSYAIDGYKFYRLNTLLSSAGDIYESAQSAWAFALGPDSDVSKVNIAYFDKEVNSFVQQISLSPDRAFAGFIPALNNTARYSPAQRPAKILIWNDAIYNKDYRPPGFNVLSDRLEFIAPRLDVIQYFQPPSVVQSQRTDKEYLFQTLPFPSRHLYVLIPYYGRRYAFVDLKNKTTTLADMDYVISGINFAIAENDIDNQNMITQIAAGTVTSGNETTHVITDTADGMWDYLQFEFTGNGGAALVGPTPLKIVVSDRVS